MRLYTVVIPAYQEERTIAHALSETWRVLKYLSTNSQILVVNDGSTDGTVDEATHAGAELPTGCFRILSLPTNQGKGRAIQTGVLAAESVYVGFLDADLATRPEELEKGFRLLEESGGDIAIGSRRVPEATIARPQRWYRSLAGQCFNVVMRRWVHLPYHDTQCGCKVFRTVVAQTLFGSLQTAGWAFDVEILLRARQAGYHIQEFPVTWRNGPTSRLHFRDAGRIFAELWRIKRLGS